MSSISRLQLSLCDIVCFEIMFEFLNHFELCKEIEVFLVTKCLLFSSSFTKKANSKSHIGRHIFGKNSSLAKILTSNSVGTKLFFLGCNQRNNHGSNFIIKKEIWLVLPEKEISNHRN